METYTDNHSYPMHACKHGYHCIYSFAITEETQPAHTRLVSVWCYGERHQFEEKATLGHQPAPVRSCVDVTETPLSQSRQKHVCHICIEADDRVGLTEKSGGVKQTRPCRAPSQMASVAWVKCPAGCGISWWSRSSSMRSFPRTLLSVMCCSWTLSWQQATQQPALSRYGTSVCTLLLNTLQCCQGSVCSD